MSSTTRAAGDLPAAIGDSLRSQLLAGETFVAWFETNLDRRLHFGQDVVVLTNTRLLSRQSGQPQGAASLGANPTNAWQSWQLDNSSRLQTSEQGGLGRLELISESGRLGWWRYTAAIAPSARRFVEQFESSRNPAGAAGGGDRTSVCPSCGGLLESENAVCATCAPAAIPPPVTSLWRLSTFARQRTGVISLGFALTLASTGAALVPPYLTIPLTDHVLYPAQAGHPVDRTLLTWLLSGLVGAAILAWLLTWARNYVLSWVSERISSDLRNRTYRHLQSLSLEYFGGKRTGDLMSRISSDTDRICNFLSLNLVDFATDAIMIMMTGIILFFINPLLATVTLISFPAMAWLTHYARSRLRHGFAQGGTAWAEMTSVLADTIPGIRVVKAFAQEQREIERFQASNDRVLSANDRVNRIWAFFGPMVILLSDFGRIFVWVVGAWMVTGGRATTGELVGFVAYITQFYGKLESMTFMVRASQRAGASAHRVFEILDRVPSVPEPVRPHDPGKLRGEIELRNVCFSYGSRRVIHNLDLHIQPGEMIGLVGRSGAGKSTLTNLICRFFDVQEGAILVDGHDLRSFPVTAYRRNIGMVLQEPFLFYGTIAENIAYGRPEASRIEIIEAARAARAHDFILQLPDGYDSIVGERGQSLSGGERQRISIARALLIDPAILILDEATSSVDTETEREIQEALEHLIQGRTTIAIAHRLSTLRRADRLVVLDRGRIVEIGPHLELLKNPGVYARLHQAQTELAQTLGI